MNSRDTSDLILVKPLTPREEEILHCLANELSNRQIADHLTVTINTVKWYARQIYNKLGVNNRGDAVNVAHSLGLLPDTQENLLLHNLPVQATPFVGRVRELSRLADFIADPSIRILTILGPGGIGKTRLALEAAKRELHNQHLFPDGIFFISLAPVNSAIEIVTTMAATLDFHFHGSENEIDQILGYLSQRQSLLIMDNFEHILEDGSILSEISKQAPGVNLIVTSREPLQLQGEQRFPLQGLQVPKIGVSIGDTVSDNAAVQLFLNIARRTEPNFQIPGGDEDQLLRICRLVEGMPLGLELAASWAGLLPLSEIASEIEQSLDLLRTEKHDAPKRHQSMQATLDASWKRLSPDQQLGFKQLTVFRGGFTRPAAFKVAGSTLPLLVTLVNKSWLYYSRQEDRYHIHELLRQYGSSKLSIDSAREQRLRDAHSTYYCDYLKKRETDWIGQYQQRAASEVKGEIDNIHQAWRYAGKEGHISLLDKGLNCLCRYYRWEGQNSEARYACRIAIEGVSRPLGEEPTNDSESLALWSRILVWQSMFANEVTEKRRELLSKSQKVLVRAASTGRDMRSEQAFLYLAEAYAAGNQDFAEAIQMAARAYNLFRELGDRWSEAESLTYMGNIYVFQGAFDQAIESLSDSLEIRRQLGDAYGIGDTTMILGLVYQHQGNYDNAEALHLDSLKIFKRLQNRFIESRVLTVLSFSYLWAGKFSVAKEAAGRSLEIRSELGRVPYLWNQIALTSTVIHLGEYDEAETRAKHILDLARKRGHSTEEGYALMCLGIIALVEGDDSRAILLLEKSARLMTKLSYVYQGLPRASLCLVLRERGDNQSAQLHLARALRSGITFHSVTPIMYCFPVAALLAVDDGRRERGIELYSLARRFGHITNSRWFEQVAGKELDKLRRSMAPEVVAVAESGAQQLDLWSVADDLVNELESPGHAN